MTRYRVLVRQNAYYFVDAENEQNAASEAVLMALTGEGDPEPGVTEVMETVECEPREEEST